MNDHERHQLDLVKRGSFRLISLIELAKKAQAITDSECVDDAEEVMEQMLIDLAELSGPKDDWLYEVLKGMQGP